MNLDKISVIIPAYKPDEKLLGTLEGLAEVGFTDIIVVDDGSGAEYEELFAEVCKMPHISFLRHEVNRGKGAALKTAFKYFLENREGMAGVVTADADGQHLPCDIAAVSEQLIKTETVVLGVRDFLDPKVPARSKTGNRITSAVFRIFFGMKVSDTQTGLRAFPTKYLEDISSAKGDRYEFETNMLFLINRRGIPMTEVKIETVYIDCNKSSHFRVVRDSLRIYGLIIKYLLSSTASAIADIAVFGILHFTGVLSFIPIPLEWSCSIAARIVSSLFNYALNAKVVFEGKMTKWTLLKYYTLAVIQIAVSSGILYLIKEVLSLNNSGIITLIKLGVDTLLFFMSFRIQHKWVFNNKETKKVKE